MAEVANNLDDSDEELGEDFVNLIAALQRTQHEDSTVVNKSLMREKEKSNEESARKASLKYLELEAEAASYKNKYSNLSIDLLEDQISQQKSCLINRDALMLTLQNIHTQGQLIETRNQLIESSKTAKELSVETTDFLESSTKSFQSEKSLNEILEENYRKKAAILAKRKRLASLQKNVTALWQQLETKDKALSQNKKEDNEDIKSAKEKLKSREARLYMIFHYIVTLLPCLPENWAKDKKTINILRAAERFFSQPAMTDLNSILSLLDQ